jgi:hypothetical protein
MKEASIEIGSGFTVRISLQVFPIGNNSSYSFVGATAKQ